MRAFFEKFAARDTVDARCEGLPRIGNLEAAEASYGKSCARKPSNPEALPACGCLIARGTLKPRELLERAPAHRPAKLLKHRLFLDTFATKHADEDLKGAAASNPKTHATATAGHHAGSAGEVHRTHWTIAASIRSTVRSRRAHARKAVFGGVRSSGRFADDGEYQRKLSNVLF